MACSSTPCIDVGGVWVLVFVRTVAFVCQPFFFFFFFTLFGINNISPSWGDTGAKGTMISGIVGIVSKANRVRFVAAAATKINKPIKTLFDRSFLLSHGCV